MNLFHIREIAIRPLPETLDRLVAASSQCAALAAWVAATGASEDDVYSVDAVPPLHTLTRQQWNELRLIEQL